MSDSLQDQLLALGLARDNPRKKQAVKANKRTNSGPKRSGGSHNHGSELSLEKAYALKKRDEQRRVDQARQKKLAEDRQRRALNNEIRAIVKAHRLNREDAEIARNFMFRGRIRKLHVTTDQLKALNAGELGIAYLSGGYHLLPSEQAETVRLLSAEHVVDLGTEAEDDGDFPVPDDISW